MKTPVYAVVDLEMTCSDLNKGKLIQFGCVFVKDDQIIGSYATDINPEELITPEIESLTGITNERVAKAPYFIEVAHEIKKYLQDCIFVAHNVNFDFKFLNHQFEEIGLKPLNCPAVDTVELAQIFYPTLDSYKLVDLAEYFNLYHGNPHQADSDAYVTAELLIKITSKIRKLPDVTIAKIIQRGKFLSLQTRQYIKHIAKQESFEKITDIEYVNHLALKKRGKQVEKYYASDKKVDYRAEQEKIRKFITNSILKTGHNFLIEAPTGIGKTRAYLAAFQDKINKYKPLVISTSSIVLQEQIQEELYKLNQTRDYKLQAIVLKSFNHYIDLTAFLDSLNKSESGPTERLWQMKILVWLTETTTGDLDEIHARRELAYIQKIQHHGLKSINKSRKIFQYDFVKRLMEQAKQSEILIVNHSYLLAEQYRNEQILPKTDYLVIDEAHKFAELFEQAAQYQLNPIEFNRKLRQLRQELHTYENLEYLTLEKLINKYLDVLTSYTTLMQNKYQNKSEPVFAVTPFFKEMTQEENQTRELLKLLTNDVIVEIEKMLQEEILSLYVKQLLLEIEQFIDLFYLFLTNKQSTLYREIKFYYDKIYYCLLDIYHRKITMQKWFNNFEKCFFIGSTLLVNNKEDYFKQILQLDKLEIFKVEDKWNYQGKVYVLNDQKENEKWYNDKQLVELLIKLVKNTKTNKILCLLTSHSQLEKTYQALNQALEGTAIQVLAQNQTGSKTRNLKQFRKANEAILLGTDIMWEGIDLTGDTLKTVVIAKLPFQVPFTEFKKYQADYLKSLGKQSFYDEALPRAMMKLRQGFGRLYRSEDDKGNLLILDKRFVESNYAKIIQKALPKQVEIVITNKNDCLKDLEK